MPVVMYTGTNSHKLSTGHNTTEGRKDNPDWLPALSFKFETGPNEVPAETWNRLQAESQSCQNLIAMGKLKPLMQSPAVQAQEATPKKPGRPKKIQVEAPKQVAGMDDIDVSKLDAWAARDLIQEVIDMDLLLRMQKQEKERGGETRKMVVEALEKQIEAMTSVESTDGISGSQKDLKANAGKQ